MLDDNDDKIPRRYETVEASVRFKIIVARA